MLLCTILLSLWRCRVSSISLLATDAQTKAEQTAELQGQVQFSQPGLVVVRTNPDGTSDVTFTREQLQPQHRTQLHQSIC
jgi:hypothetical protein